MVDAEVDIGVRARGVEITAFAELVRVGAVAFETEAFLAGGDHVRTVERFDVGCGVGHPFVEDIEVAAVAARLVGELPGENGRRVAVAANDCFDVRFVLRLGFLADVPFGVGFDAGVGEVGGHASIIGPVVDEVDDELDAVLFGALDDVVQALEAVGAGVDLGFAVDEGLVVDGVSARVGGHVVEAPNAKDFHPRAGDVLHDEVDIGIVGLEADPVGVGASEVLLLAVDDEVCS